MSARQSLVLLPLALTVAMLSHPASGNEVQMYAKISAISGTVTDAAGGAVKVGQRFKTGDTLKTGEKSYVDLALMSDNYTSSALRLESSSELNLTQLFEYSLAEPGKAAAPYVQTQLELRSGNLSANVKPITAGRFQVKTASGVAGIRGTAFRVGSSGAILVLEGAVEATLTLPNGRTVTIPVGQGRRLNVTPEMINNLASGGLTVTDIGLLMRASIDEMDKLFDTVDGLTRNTYSVSTDGPNKVLFGAVTDPEKAKKYKKRRGIMSPASPPSPSPGSPPSAP
jgi:hypothetical protein